MRPGNLHGIGNYWFGDEKSKAKPTKSKILHPDIYKYSRNHLDVAARRGKLKVKEVAEQIYRFDLFTPEFCKKLIEEAEFQGKWSTGIDQEPSSSFSGFGMMKLDPSLFKSLKTENEKDTTFSLKDFPKLPNGNSLTKTINDTTKKVVAPVISKLWKSFEVERYDQPYLLKYEPDKVNKMNLHYDFETVAMVCYLNTEYEGGGTYFPRWKLHLQPKRAGQAGMWPGGLSHEHIGVPITAGVRYLLCCAFF
jgi:hypothetical protein